MFKVPDHWGSFKPSYIPECACHPFSNLLYYLFTLRQEETPRRMDRKYFNHRYHSSDLQYSVSVGEAPLLLNADDNPSLKNTFYKHETGQTISAFDRLNFMFCRIRQAEEVMH